MELELGVRLRILTDAAHAGGPVAELGSVNGVASCCAAFRSAGLAL